MATCTNFLNANLNDERLTNRFNIIVPQLEGELSSTIPEASPNKGAMKGIYRFFRNLKVQPESLIAAHLEQLNFSDDSQPLPRYLSLSDSTELDYTGKKGATNLGPLSYPDQRGMVLHNSMIIRDNGAPVGLLRQDYIIRSDEDFGKTDERRYLPIEQKESIKWLNHFNTAQSLCTQYALEMVYIADRESDIMDIYHARWHENMHFVIRSQHNRNLENTTLKLYEVLTEQEILGTYDFELVDHKTGKARTATISIRFCQAPLKLAGRAKKGKHLGVNWVTAIEAFEANPPKEIDKPIRWVLLTSLPIEDFQSAQQIVQYYLLRWLIERFFFLLKSGGANVERLQMKKPHQLKNAIATYSIAAMNVMKIRYLAQNQPDMTLEDAGISTSACEVLYQYAHHKVDSRIAFDEKHPPTMKEFCIVLGRIGGFIPSKRQPLPGFKILSRAYKKYSIILDIYDVYLFQRTDEKDVGYQ